MSRQKKKEARVNVAPPVMTKKQYGPKGKKRDQAYMDIRNNMLERYVPERVRGTSDLEWIIFDEATSWGDTPIKPDIGKIPEWQKGRTQITELVERAERSRQLLFNRTPDEITYWRDMMQFSDGAYQYTLNDRARDQITDIMTKYGCPSSQALDRLLTRAAADKMIPYPVVRDSEEIRKALFASIGIRLERTNGERINLSPPLSAFEFIDEARGPYYKEAVMISVSENDWKKVNTTNIALTNQLTGVVQANDEMKKILEGIQKEPLLLHSIDRVDDKHAFIKKGDQTLRIEKVKDLVARDEVLLHPKTFQIVERLGKPPLEVSRFCPESVPNVTWDDIGGLEDAKADMIEAIEMPHTNADLWKYYNKRMVKGILLSGPPGCGKTMLGKAAANSLARIYGKGASRTGFLYVKGPEILNKYVGATEETVRDMFWDARRHREEHGYPAIIFIDEADAIMGARGSRSTGIGNTIVPMFLTEMDGLEDSHAIVIIATNRPDILDPAIVRDGRVDRKVIVKRPNVENAHKIILMNLQKFPLADGESIEYLAEDMAKEMFSDERYVHGDVRLRDMINGAMLSGCVDLAVSNAIRRDLAAGTRSGIMPQDIIAAIDRTQTMNHGIRHELEKETA